MRGLPDPGEDDFAKLGGAGRIVWLSSQHRRQAAGYLGRRGLRRRVLVSVQVGDHGRVDVGVQFSQRAGDDMRPTNGFTVSTPTAEVVNLGTSFGIDLQEDGVSRVSVFDGEVEVALPDSTEKRLLKEGDSVRVEAGQSIEDIDLDPEPFSKVWPVSSCIARSTKAFRFVPPWPKKFRFVQSDDDIFIVPEGYGITLSNPLRLNISRPGEYANEDELTPSEVAAGERIRSFLMFFRPEREGPLRIRKQVTGSITFDSDVLGVIVLSEELDATSRRFARIGPREVRKRHQLELTGDADGDAVTLSDDRRTVTLKLTTPARFAESLRVIMDASQPTSAENGH